MTQSATQVIHKGSLDSRISTIEPSGECVHTWALLEREVHPPNLAAYAFYCQHCLEIRGVVSFDERSE